MRKFFNLAELLVVIVIIAILAAIILPNIKDFQQTANVTALKSDIKVIQLASDKFKIDKGVCPSDKQPVLGNPQAINFNILYPDYLRKLPKEREAYYWVNQDCTVFGSTIDAPKDVKVDKLEGSISWTTNPNSKKNYIFEKVNERDIKLVNENQNGNYNGKDGTIHLVSEEDINELETPPVGENYEGYPIEGTMPEENNTISCEKDGFICIYTAEELAKIGVDSGYPLNGKYRLANDIDLSSFDKWLPIGSKDAQLTGKIEGDSFTGTLDGNYFSIKNFTFNHEEALDVGLFYKLSSGAKVTNLSFTNSYIKAYTNVGTLSAFADNGVLIENVSMQGEIHAIDYEYTHGEPYITEQGEGWYSYAKLSSIGGLIGYAENNVTFKDVSADIKMTTVGKSWGVGGICGECSYGVQVEDAYVKGDIDVHSGFGGIAGDFSDFSDNFDTPPTITNAQTDLTIRTYNFTIPNVPYYEQPDSESIGGIAGYSMGGIIDDTQANVNMVLHEDTYSAGGSVGFLDEKAKIQNSSSSGSIYAINVEIGGLIGYTSEAEILHSHSSVDVEVPSGWYVGGLIGYAGYYESSIPTIIKEVYATGDVSGDTYIGGLIGYHDGSSADAFNTVENSYTTGNVTGNEYVGGLIGNVYPSPNVQPFDIINTYATGEVTGNAYVGGLIGSFDGYSDNTSLKNSFALNTKVTGTGLYVGRIYGEDVGLVKENNFGLNTLITPNMDKTRTGKDGEDITIEQAKSSSIYKSSGWDFENIWQIQEGSSYPTLK